MAEEIGFENGRNSNFQGLVTLTLHPAIRHTVVHHSSTSTYIPNFIQIEKNFLWTDGHFSPSNIIRSTFGSRPNNTFQLSAILKQLTTPPPSSLAPTKIQNGDILVPNSIIGASQLAVMLSGWEGNRRAGIVVAMHHIHY